MQDLIFDTSQINAHSRGDTVPSGVLPGDALPSDALPSDALLSGLLPGMSPSGLLFGDLLP